MNRFISSALALFVVILCSSTALAFDEGTISVGAQSSGFKYSSLDVDGVGASSTDIELSVGYFFRENLEIGLIFGSHTDDDDINGSSSYTIFMPNFMVYFPVDENYISLGLAFENASGDLEGSSFNFGAGYVLMINDRLSFNMGFQYTTGDVDAGSGSVDFDGYMVSTGFSIYFSK